jgi:hypothetical protein
MWKSINTCNNIVKLIDFEITDKAALLLMELCTGKIKINNI